jgi:hypothetical protein
MTTDVSSIAKLTSSDGNIVIIGNYQVSAVNGTYTFQGIKLITQPNTESYLTIDGGRNEELDITVAVNMSVAFRECIAGEIETIDKSCYVCAEETYSVNGLGDSCFPCPDEAICEGSNVMYPKANYWRAN